MRLPLHTLPEPWPIAALAGCGGAEIASVSAFLRCNNLFPPIALAWREGRKQLDVPISFSLLLVSRWCCPPLLDLTFPICRLSLPTEKSKLGQVLTSFLVGHRKEIKAQVKSLPHRALFTFPIISHIASPQTLGTWLCFSEQTQKFVSNSTKKSGNLNKVHWSCWEKKGASRYAMELGCKSGQSWQHNWWRRCEKQAVVCMVERYGTARHFPNFLFCC